MSHYTIRFTNIEKRFAKRQLFSIPEISLVAGKCMLLSGINGSGKSTLLKILAGLEKPDNADVILNEQTRSWKSAYKAIHRDIIYLHQSPLMFDASVADNICYGMRKQYFHKSTIQERLQAALKWADINHIKDNNARSLSGGEKQRVALARAYVLEPRFLLLDEAFANMDTDGRRRTFEQVCKLKKEGIGIVLTSHEPNMFMALADEHMELKNGKLSHVENYDGSTATFNLLKKASIIEPTIQSIA